LAGLDVIHKAITTCEDCDLCQERTNAVPGEGSVYANIMFIGEGPGLNEDLQGRPFIGAAGKFLTQMIESIGLQRKDVFITNMVKCRPPDNRDPLPTEIEACAHYLDSQIAEIAPIIIVPLGRHALARWFPGEAIGKVRAQPKLLNGFTIFPLYHPAAALHNGGLRSTIEEDFAKLGALLANLVGRASLGASSAGVADEAIPEPLLASESRGMIVEPEQGLEQTAEPNLQQLNMF
jgi:uracil-DNA glycosylase family 4